MSLSARELWTYSHYRDAELRGANLIFRLLRMVTDGESQILLTKHLDEETYHAWLWTELIHKHGATPMEVLVSYQTRLGGRIGMPRSALELLVLSIVAEQRGLARYQEHLARPDTPEDARDVLSAVIGDEGWHISWLTRRAQEMAGPGVFEQLLDRYTEIDREAAGTLEEEERQYLAQENEGT